MLAEMFGVSLGYVEKIFRQRAATGQVERVRYRPGPKSRVSAAVTARMVELVGAEPDLTVAELQERIATTAGALPGTAARARGGDGQSRFAQGPWGPRVD